MYLGGYAYVTVFDFPAVGSHVPSSRRYNNLQSRGLDPPEVFWLELVALNARDDGDVAVGGRAVGGGHAVGVVAGHVASDGPLHSRPPALRRLPHRHGLVVPPLLPQVVVPAHIIST